MTHVQYTPHPLLQPYIASLWTAERTFAPPHSQLDILPDSYIELVFTSGGRFFLGQRQLPPYFVLGLLDQPVQLQGQGTIITVAARFFAWGFAALFGRSPATAIHPPIGDDWGTIAAQIAQLAPHNPAAASAALHEVLLTRALALDIGAYSIDQATRQLLAEGLPISSRTLADRCHLSRRQAERKFSHTIGISAKQLERRVRFQQARDALWRMPASRLAELATQLGYADQAHFAREFKAFSGRTPRQFAAEAHLSREELRRQGVAFLQDITSLPGYTEP